MDEEGWLPDPFGVHEYRYFAGGRATNLVGQAGRAFFDEPRPQAIAIAVPAGWYDDPAGDGQRFWDGAVWTDSVRAGDVESPPSPSLWLFDPPHPMEELAPVGETEDRRLPPATGSDGEPAPLPSRRDPVDSRPPRLPTWATSSRAIDLRPHLGVMTPAASPEHHDTVPTGPDSRHDGLYVGVATPAPSPPHRRRRGAARAGGALEPTHGSMIGIVRKRIRTTGKLESGIE